MVIGGGSVGLIWAAFADALAGIVERGARPEPSEVKPPANAIRPAPTDLAEISSVVVGLAQLALARP